eukprot:3593257-Heterocapsa_arctica.AAC.1
MTSVSSCTAQARPEVFQDVMLAEIPVQLLSSCPSFLAPPIMIPVVLLCSASRCGPVLLR